MNATTELHAARAMHLFRGGADTLTIASRLSVTEACASYLVYLGRSRQKQKPVSIVRQAHRPLLMWPEFTRAGRLAKERAYG